MLSAVQTLTLSHEAQSRAEAAILGDTVRVASPVLQHILRAQGAAATLASAVSEVDNDPGKCHEILSRFARANPLYTLVGFIPTNGVMTCSGSGLTHDFTGSSNFRDAIKEPGPTFEVNHEGPVSGTGVLVVVNPVEHSDGRRSGIIVLSIPQHALEVSQAGAADSSGVPPSLRLFTFDSDGNVLTSTKGYEKDKRYLPRDRALKTLAGDRSIAFTATDANGHRRIFAVVPIVVGKLYALSSWPGSYGQGEGALTRLPPLILPALMAIVSLFAAWMAAEVLVLRHIRRLRHAIRAFASGSRVVPLPGKGAAPLEIREVEESFERMTETILRDEAELEDAVHQKEVLLREVHHRIKNNLQLIASIMNLQMRREKSPEVKGIMKNLQDRVMSLATIHRGLYLTSGVSDVRADELLSGIVNQVLSFSTGDERRFEVETDFADILLTPDQAVPLSLLLTEALTNAMKYAGAAAPGAEPKLSVSLTREAGTGARLLVENSLPEDIPDAEEAPPALDGPSGFGSHLIRAFAQQLGGKMETGQSDGTYRLDLQFSVTPLTRGEAGSSSAAEEQPPAGPPSAPESRPDAPTASSTTEEADRARLRASAADISGVFPRRKP
ncbi:sensor histidine kinase [Acidimangrovimonas sediminis]|uniref:sensor histidine kinase n=1 Tax=Acidimangrovimonas sediminis TaxID=2056283 RepID=UPI001E420324|nr:histidine kinase dimerization/phosphoacceptor domain -containing protein [Acidimangrovimonas sediminis]